MMEREEEMEKTELEKRTQEEEEKIMKKCMEKVKKNTKPYELPWNNNTRRVFKAMGNSP